MCLEKCNRGLVNLHLSGGGCACTHVCAHAGVAWGQGDALGVGGSLELVSCPGVGCPQATPDHHSTLSLSNLGLQLKKLSIFIAIKLFLCAQLGGLQGSWSEFPEQHQGAVYATSPQGSNAEKSRPPGKGCKGPLGEAWGGHCLLGLA